jgi:microtubule-associated protein-like 6
LSKNDGLIAKGKVTRREVFDIRFVPGDWQLVVACMKEVNLITWKDGNLLSERTIWKNYRPEAALGIGFVEGYTVTGMFSG